jgi:hypothetical protein
MRQFLRIDIQKPHTRITVTRPSPTYFPLPLGTTAGLGEGEHTLKAVAVAYDVPDMANPELYTTLQVNDLDVTNTDAVERLLTWLQKNKWEIVKERPLEDVFKSIEESIGKIKAEQKPE